MLTMNWIFNVPTAPKCTGLFAVARRSGTSYRLGLVGMYKKTIQSRRHPRRSCFGRHRYFQPLERKLRCRTSLRRVFITGLLEKVASSNRSEEHTSELQSRFDLVCRLLLAK